MQQKSRSFLHNSLSAYVPFIVDFFLKILLVKTILSLLGLDLLGTWGILKAVVVLPLFLQEGVCFAVFLAITRGGEMRRAIGEAVTLSIALTGAVALLIIIFSGGLSSFLRIPETHHSMAVMAFRISAFSFIFGALAQLFLYVLRGLGRFDLSSAIQTPVAIVNSLFSIWMLHHGHQILSLMIVDLASSAVLLVLSAFVTRRMIGEDWNVFTFRWSRMILLLRETAGQFLYSFGARALWELDSVLIPRFFGVRSMASYWIGRKIPYTWGDFMWVGVWPAVPATAGHTDATERLTNIHWLQVSLALPIACALFFYSQEILTVWLGGQDLIASFAMRVLVVAVAADFFPAILVSYLFQTGRVFRVAKMMLVGIGSKVVVAVVAYFTNSFHILLLSTMIGAIIFAVGVVVMASRFLQERSTTFMKPLIPSGIASGMSLGVLQSFSFPSGLVALLLQFIIFLVLTSFFTLLLVRLFFSIKFSELIRFLVNKSQIFYLIYSRSYRILRMLMLARARAGNLRKARFEKVYAEEDPWDYKTSDYEQEKYSEMLEFLDGRKFNRALEFGCSEGVFTRQLAPLCERVIAYDISATAVARAKTYNFDFQNVEIQQLDVVTELIPKDADLICCGEILNCLSSRKHLQIVKDKIVDSLKFCGLLLLVNLHLFPDDKKGLTLRDLGFGSTYIRNVFSADPHLRIVREADHPQYRITLFERIENQTVS